MPPHWTTRLPAAAENVMESDTLKFLGVLPPTSVVAGMQIPTDPTLITFAIPDGATGAGSSLAAWAWESSRSGSRPRPRS